MFVDFDFNELKNKKVCVAVSGGADSMALLHFLLSLRKDYSFSVSAINVEHGIRGKSSLDDTNFVKSYCEKINVPIYVFSVDCPNHAKENKLSLEESARILRYECFYSLLNSKKCDVIATAHHLSDNAESTLLNIFRGCGIDGLCGIENYSNKIIRPLLSVSKEDILLYVKDNDIPFVTDQTNFCDDYTRNYLRLNVIPKIKEVFPEFEKSLYRLSQIAKENTEYILSKAEERIKIIDRHTVAINLPVDKPIFFKCVVLALNSLNVNKDWEKKHIDSAYELTRNQTGKRIDFPFGITVYKEGENLVFTKNTNSIFTSILFFPKDFEFLGKDYKITTLTEKPQNLKDGLYLDLDKIPSGAVIRNKQDGDVFKITNGKTKKLSDFLLEKKVPFRKRDFIPLIAKDNVIYAIFGLAVSEQTKIDEKTKNIIKIN